MAAIPSPDIIAILDIHLDCVGDLGEAAAELHLVDQGGEAGGGQDRSVGELLQHSDSFRGWVALSEPTDLGSG